MKIPATLIWTPQEAAAVNEFLNTQVGRKWLGILLSRKPRLELTTTERAALSGAFAAGYEAFFGEIAQTRTFMEPEAPNTKTIDMTRD